MSKISVEARKELVAAAAARYQIGSTTEKGRILDEFAALTGFQLPETLRVERAQHRQKRLYGQLPPPHPAQCRRQADPIRAQPVRRLFQARRPAGRAHDLLNFGEPTGPVGRQAVRQQADRPPRSPAQEPPHPHAVRLLATVGPVRDQPAVALPVVRAGRRTCVPPGLPRNVVLDGEVRAVSNLDGAVHGPANADRAGHLYWTGPVP